MRPLMFDKHEQYHINNTGAADCRPTELVTKERQTHVRTNNSTI